MPPDTSAVDTEVELLRSRALAEAVVKSLKLYNDPEFNPKAKPLKTEEGLPARVSDTLKSLTGVQPLQAAAASEKGAAPAAAPAMVDDETISKVTTTLQRRSAIRRVGLTYVVHIGFTAGSAAKAEKIANAFIDAYVNRQMSLKVAAVIGANNEVDQSVTKLRQDALDAEAKVQEYKTDNNLLSIEGLTMAESEVSALNRQIAEAKADHAEKEARVNTAASELKNGAGGGNFLGSDTINELRKSEAAARVQLAELETRFKADYPEVKRAQAQLDDIHRQINLETTRILTRLRYEEQAAAQRMVSLMDSRTRAQNDLSSNGRARVGLVALQQRADAARNIYENYLNRSSELAVEKSLQQADATVNYKAAVSGGGSPGKRLLAAVAAFIGLVGAVATVLLTEFWTRRVRSRIDVERDLAVPLAAVLPDFKSVPRVMRRQARLSGPADHLVEYPYTTFAEAFRNLRAFLSLSPQTGGSKVIAISSALPREGKSLTSLCLARTLAATGSSVVLVDCDLRQRGTTRLAGEPEYGIREVIEDNLPFQQALVRDKKTNAQILGATNRASIPDDLFGGDKIQQLLQRLSASFDYVILDTPPLIGIADARMLVSKADCVLYVVQWNKTPTSTARAAIKILRECGAKIAGTLLTQVNIKQQARFGYEDGSDYFHAYSRYYLSHS